MKPNFKRMASLTLLLAALAVCGHCPAEEVNRASVAQLNQFVASQQFDDAVQLGRELDAAKARLEVDLTLPFARLARALQRQGDLQNAIEFYQRAVDASGRPAAGNLSAESVIWVRLAAASVMTQTKRYSEALDSLRPALADDSQASEQQAATAVSICLRIGSAALQTGGVNVAAEAYANALALADPQQHPTAMLGDAWAMAIAGREPLQAAKKLASFIERYPDHADGARAARACAECLKQAGRKDDSSTMLADLLQRWPDSEAASEVVRSHADLAVDLVPRSVRIWLMQKANKNDLQALDAKTTLLGILIATQQNELSAWENLARHLAMIDQSGQPTADLLSTLVDQGDEGEAERLAATMIVGDARVGGDVPAASDENATPSAAARESACRWAGRTMRWSMLAMAAESEDLQQPAESRTIAIERLFAESLMQTGQVAEAGEWWNHLIDQRGVNDFATLLRCAEAETSVGRDAAVAERRIEAARMAAGEDRFRGALVDLVNAELAIRRLQFDQARGMLETVVRARETDASLRGRAQFLSGETYYLQQKFADAIEAYRRVEGIDPGGIWVSASLLQAGKSFEQLGRTREAAVCYGNLLGRFADTQHATLARRRLAAITPQNRPSNESPTTIRR